ncbi:hypothetical protein V3N99_21335 [Dermatophilaceae bacterium Soc4.6]
MGVWALGLSVAGALLGSGALWLALDSMSVSGDPLGSAPQWLAVGGGAAMVLVVAAALGLGAVVTARGRALGMWALLTALVLSPLLSFVSVTLGVNALQDRAKASLASGAGTGVERVVHALGDLGVPEGPARILIEGRK